MKSNKEATGVFTPLPSTPVQMRFQSKTIERIEHLTQMTGSNNKTQLIASAIQLTEQILEGLIEGDKIMIEKKDGTKEILKIVGIGN
jgi:hypothetical protein